MSTRQSVKSTPTAAPLPLLALRRPQPLNIGGCLLTFTSGGKLVVKIKGQKESTSLNPFAYAAKEGVIQGLLKFSDPRRLSIIPSWQRKFRSQDDADFAEYVLLEEEFLTIKEAEQSGRVNTIKKAATENGIVQLPETAVVPSPGKDPVWVVVDSWHLSRVSRDGDIVRAEALTLSAPFADLTSWFMGVSDKIREVKEQEVFEVIERAMMFVGRKSLSAITLGAVKDDRKVDPRIQQRGSAVGVWANELLREPTSGEWLYAHELFLGNVDEREWWARVQFLDVGFVSLEGAPILAVPGASEITKAILEKYITAPRNCFDSKKTVLSRLKMDRSLSESQKKEVTYLLHRRRTFVIKDALYRYRAFRGSPHVNIILKNPMNGYSQIMLESADVRDCPMIMLRLVKESPDWPTKTDLAGEEQQIRDQSQSDEDYEQQIAFRRLMTAAGKASSSDTFMEGAKLVVALEELSKRDGEDRVLGNALKGYRSGIADEYREMARHFKRMYAVNMSENVLIFLLVLMIEDQTPYAGWMTRKMEAMMHTLRMNEQQFEAVVAGVVAVKTAFFFGEGLWEAWEEGLSISSLVRGLSYSFTWTYISPEGNLEFFGKSLVENAPDILALGPLYGAARFGLSMLQHAKHGFDTIAELRRANTASTTGSKVLTAKDVAKVLQVAMNMYVVPWNSTLTEYEGRTGDLDPAYGEYTFESTPLGIPALSGRNRVPLLKCRPGDTIIEGVIKVVYDPTTNILRVGGRLDKTFRYEYYVLFQKEADSKLAGEMWTADGCEAEEDTSVSILDGNLVIENGTCSFSAPMLLFFPTDEVLIPEVRVKIITSFIADDCYRVSGTEPDSRLGVTLRVALLAVLARAMELEACSDSSDTQTILMCLLRGEDHLPRFVSKVVNSNSEIAISDVSREFCA